MHDYILSCCSTVDLTAKHLQDRNVSWLPFHFFLDEKEYFDDMFTKTMTPEDFYTAMAKGAMTRTSQVNATEYYDYFEKFVKEGKAIVHATLSSGLSGSYNSANPTDVYALFKTAPDDLRKESRFHTSINIYRSNIALSSCEGETDETYRIIASKAADKMLTLKGIDAAFTLVKIGDQIHISGRSSGKINVQLILEKLHGGGHFDVAGAQVVNESVMNVLETLKSSIDEYFNSEDR